MSDYWDAIAFRKTKQGKTRAVRLGSAKARDDGGWNVWLDSIPAPEDGSYSFSIVPQRNQTGRGAANDHATPANQLDDEIPF